jgi:acyl phosphate:glycerol-3-phosphate acyltransferase
MSWIEHLRSANWGLAGCVLIFSYLLGCFTAGYYLVRVRTGQDIRTIGSGNVGAKNVGRVLGKGGFFLTLLLDFAKGSLAVWAARQLAADERIVAAALLAVVVGHIWPAQLRFHGGKGMATALGALLVLDPHLVLAFAMVFLLCFAVLRKTVLPGLLAFAGLPLAGVFLDHSPASVFALALLAALVLFAHRKNLAAEFHQLSGRRNIRPEPDQTQP